MADPLSLLRQYNIQKKEIIERDNLIIFDQLAWPKTVNTNYVAYRGKDDESKQCYTLESILFLLKNVKLPHPLYVSRAIGLDVPIKLPVRLPDRRELLQYLNGEIETTASIDKSAPLEVPTQPPTLKRGPKDLAIEAKKPRLQSRMVDQLGIQDGAASLEDQMKLKTAPSIIKAIPLEKIAAIKAKHKAKKRATRDDDFFSEGLQGYGAEVVADIQSRERQHKTRTTVLQSAGKSFENLLTVLQSVKAKEEGKLPEVSKPKEPVPKTTKSQTSHGYSRYDQERFKGTQDTFGFKIDTTQSNIVGLLKSTIDSADKKGKRDTQDTSGKSPRSKKESRMPIIIVPSMPTSLITIYNVKDFLQDNKFVTTEEKKKSGEKRQTELIILRKKPDPSHPGNTISIPYLVLDNPVKLHPQDWKRVVAVWAGGPLWQFKGWPYLTRDGSPTDIFAKIKGFHLKYEETALDPNIKKWDVQVLSVSKLKRHLDKIAVIKFWEHLDKFLIKNYQHLKF